MKGEQHQIKKAVEAVGASMKEGLQKEASSKEFQSLASNILRKPGMTPKDAMGLSNAMVEGIYGQAYRLYNTGKYREASQLFRLLIMLNSNESKYLLGLAACFHMLKEYQNAIEMYMLCGMVDPKNPIPHYHASDCYLQVRDHISALIALEMAIKRSANRPEFQTLKDRAALTVESLKKEIATPKEF